MSFWYWYLCWPTVQTKPSGGRQIWTRWLLVKNERSSFDTTVWVPDEGVTIKLHLLISKVRAQTIPSSLSLSLESKCWNIFQHANTHTESFEHWWKECPPCCSDPALLGQTQHVHVHHVEHVEQALRQTTVLHVFEPALRSCRENRGRRMVCVQRADRLSVCVSDM